MLLGFVGIIGYRENYKPWKLIRIPLVGGPAREILHKLQESKGLRLVKKYSDSQGKRRVAGTSFWIQTWLYTSLIPWNSQSLICHLEAGDRDLKSSQVYPWEFSYKVSQLEPRHFGKLTLSSKLIFEKGSSLKKAIDAEGKQLSFRFPKHTQTKLRFRWALSSSSSCRISSHLRSSPISI